MVRITCMQATSCAAGVLNLLLWHSKCSCLREGDVPGKGRPIFGLSVNGIQRFPTKMAMLLMWSNKMLFTQIKSLSQVKMTICICSIDLCFDSEVSLGVSLGSLPCADSSWVIILLQHLEKYILWK